jgi:hypothetical protein
MAGKATTSGRVAPAPRRGPPLRIRVARRLITGLVWSTYLGLGVVTAGAYGYLDVDRVGAAPVLSAALAVIAWPAVFLGASVHV